MLGIGLSLALSERLAAGHWALPDEIAFGWAVGSLAMLAALVVSLPDLTSSWTKMIERSRIEDLE